MESPHDQTASIMTPAKLAQMHSPKPPASPAAWLDKMASDAGHMHLRRLGELRAELQVQAAGRGDQPLAAALAQLHQALPRLDFDLLQARGFWARATGKSRSAGAEFAARFEEVDQAATLLAGQVQALARRHPGEAAAIERTLVEFEVEYRALDKIIEQGARWLRDMREQLKARHAQAPDAQAQQQVREDAARCEILVGRLKQLRVAANAAQQAHQQAQALATRRAALLQMLQQAGSADVKAWRVRMSALAGAAGDDGAPALSLEGPVETHRELQLCVQQAVADTTELQAHEDSLAQVLAALGQHLSTPR